MLKNHSDYLELAAQEFSRLKIDSSRSSYFKIRPNSPIALGLGQSHIGIRLLAQEWPVDKNSIMHHSSVYPEYRIGTCSQNADFHRTSYYFSPTESRPWICLMERTQKDGRCECVEAGNANFN